MKGSHGWRRSTVVLVLFVLVGIGIYWNALNNGFHYDDFHHVVNNPYTKSLSHIPDFFTKPWTFTARADRFAHYRPLVLVSYALNYAADGLKPRGYHLVNLAFHIGSAFLVFLIARILTSDFPALAAGLLFLTTPFNSEVVNYITARSSVMSGFFSFLAFFYWVKHRSGVGNPRFYIASLFTFLLAVLSKETAVTLPLAFWFYDRYRVRTLPPSTSPGESGRSTFSLLSRRNILPYLPFLAAGPILVFLVRKLFFDVFVGGGVGSDPLGRLIMGVRIAAKYLQSIVFPIHLSLEHLIPKSMDAGFAWALVILIAAGFLVYLCSRSRDPLWGLGGFAFSWFIVALLPVLLVPLTTVYQENRGYVAAFGIVLMAAVGMEKLGARISASQKGQRAMAYSLLGGVVFFYGLGVIDRNPVWRDDLTLWSDVVQQYPQSTGGHLILGSRFAGSGKWDLAEREFGTVLRIDPENAEGLTGMGLIDLENGNLNDAEKMFRHALANSPLPFVHLQLGRVFRQKGDFQQAGSEYWQALVEKDPVGMEAASQVVDIGARLGKIDEIELRLRDISERNPSDPVAQFGLALIAQRRGDWGEAKMRFFRVLQSMPDNLPALLGMGLTYQAVGNREMADRIYHKLQVTYPHDPVLQKGVESYQRRESLSFQSLAMKDYYNLRLEQYREKADLQGKKPAVSEGSMTRRSDDGR